MIEPASYALPVAPGRIRLGSVPLRHRWAGAWQPRALTIAPRESLAIGSRWEYEAGVEGNYVMALFGDVTRGRGTYHEAAVQLPSGVDPDSIVGPNWMTLKFGDAWCGEHGESAPTAARGAPAVDDCHYIEWLHLYEGDGWYVNVQHTPLGMGIKTKIVCRGEGYPTHYECTIKKPDGYSLRTDPACICVLDEAGAVVFALDRWLPARDVQTGETCQAAWELHHYGATDGLDVCIVMPTQAGLAWLEAGARADIEIDPNIMATADSGHLLSASFSSWTNARTGPGDRYWSAWRNVLLEVFTHYGFTYPGLGWYDRKAYLRFNTQPFSYASVMLYLKTIGVYPDGGTIYLRQLTSDYGSLTTADWSATVKKNEGTWPVSGLSPGSWTSMRVDASLWNNSDHACYVLAEAHDVNDVDPNDQGGYPNMPIYGAAFYGTDSPGNEPYVEGIEQLLGAWGKHGAWGGGVWGRS